MGSIGFYGQYRVLWAVRAAHMYLCAESFSLRLSEAQLEAAGFACAWVRSRLVLGAPCMFPSDAYSY